MAIPVEDDAYEPDRPSRRVMGPVFGLACLAATSTGVVVLSVMLGAVIGTVATWLPRTISTARGYFRSTSSNRIAIRSFPATVTDHFRSSRHRHQRA